MAYTPRRYKESIFEQFARIGKAVSSPARLELLDLLCQAPRTVERLAKEARLSMANASRHLQVLREAGLIVGEKRGLFVTYRIADSAVCAFYRSIRTLAEDRLAEVERISREFLSAREGMEPVDRDALLQRVHDRLVTVLDVRPPEEYAAGHVPGAISIPLEELEGRLAELPKSGEIVAYCRGPYCVLAVMAVETLRENGYHAVRMAEGMPEWRELGLPVEKGAGLAALNGG